MMNSRVVCRDFDNGVVPRERKACPPSVPPLRLYHDYCDTGGVEQVHTDLCEAMQVLGAVRTKCRVHGRQGQSQ